jgi:hypothetical protein
LETGEEVELLIFFVQQPSYLQLDCCFFSLPSNLSSPPLRLKPLFLRPAPNPLLPLISFFSSFFSSPSS